MRSGRRRVALRIAAAVVVLPLLPIPWRAAPPSAGPGTAWRIDGRLEVGGAAIDPPGEVLWLAAGRPQLVWERAREALTGRGRGIPLTRGDAATTPAVAVDAAVAAAYATLGTPPPERAARIAMRIGGLDLGALADGLHLGDSHGLAIAVAVLRAAGAVDLGEAQVAATGRVTADGTVLPVGGLGPKVRAAERAGATWILVPLDQVDEAAAAAARPDLVVGVARLTDLIGSDRPRRPSEAGSGAAGE